MMVFGASAVQANIEIYLNSDCSGTSAFSAAFDITYALGADVTTPAGAKEINTLGGHTLMTVHNDMIIGIYNAQKYCGLTWVRDVAQDITGKTCGTDNKIPDIGEARYSIYTVQGSKLLMGKSSTGFDGKTPATRHNTLETSTLVKQ